MFVKICGITSEEDALLAIALGADALGFMFAAGSKRLVAPGRVADIVRRLPPEILTIGVFRDELPERVVDVVGRAGLGGAQLHGHERPEQAAYVAQHVGFTIQAFAAGDAMLTRSGEYPVNAILVDNKTPGSGEVFDWSLVDGVPINKPLLLAGGLTAQNVSSAIAAVRPWGVDVSTGVESEPGRKDPRKLRSFISAAKQAGRAIEPDDEPTTDAPAQRPFSRDRVYDWEEDND